MHPVSKKIRRWYRKRLVAKHAIDSTMWTRVVGKLDLLAGLTPAELERLREISTLFIQRKQFFGIYEMEIVSEVRVAIAAQACLLILNRTASHETHLYPGWSSIILYPGPFVTRHHFRDAIGVVHEQIAALEGETSRGGPIVLSWEDARPNATAPGEGRNVVLHEFAHKLDFMNGVSNGFPPLPAGMSVEDWSRSFTHAFEHLSHRVDHHHPTPFNPYAATNPAEFFAVMTEAFFQIPHHLREIYPHVYDQLQRYYKQDPIERRPPVAHLHKRFRT